MKRKLTILILTLILGGFAFYYLSQGRFDPLQEIRRLSPDTRQSEGLFSGAGTGNRIEVNETQPRQRIDNPGIPLWRGDATKDRMLVKLFTIGGPAPGAFEFHKIIDLEFATDGSLYVLDFGYKSIERFDPSAKHVQTLGIGPNRTRILSQPNDMTVVAGDHLYVADSRKGVIAFDRGKGAVIAGTALYQIEALSVSPAGDLLVLTPADTFLVHKFSPNGRELVAFAPHREPESAVRQVFGQAYLAHDAIGHLYLSFSSPYRLLKFDENGQPLLEFSRDLGQELNPPQIRRDEHGRVHSVLRQEVSFDLAFGSDGLLYNLVRTEGATGGELIDVFSQHGRYVQTFFLGQNATAIALHADLLAVVYPSKNPLIEVYRIQVISSD